MYCREHHPCLLGSLNRHVPYPADHRRRIGPRLNHLNPSLQLDVVEGVFPPQAHEFKVSSSILAERTDVAAIPELDEALDEA